MKEDQVFRCDAIFKAVVTLENIMHGVSYPANAFPFLGSLYNQSFNLTLLGNNPDFYVGPPVRSRLNGRFDNGARPGYSRGEGIAGRRDLRRLLYLQTFGKTCDHLLTDMMGQCRRQEKGAPAETGMKGQKSLQ